LEVCAGEVSVASIPAKLVEAGEGADFRLDDEDLSPGARGVDVTDCCMAWSIARGRTASVRNFPCDDGTDSRKGQAWRVS